jgi:hypothetical protein
MAYKYPDRPLSSLANAPFIGPTMSKLGYAAQILATPCAPTPQIWVKAFWTASPIIIYTFIKPFFYAWQWEMRTGKSHRGAKGIINFGKELFPKTPVQQTAAWAVFEPAVDLILKVEWYLFVAEMTSKFLLNWISAAYEYQGCKFPGEFFAQASMKDIFIIQNAETKMLNPWQVTYSDGRHGEALSIEVPPGISGSLSFYVNFTGKKFLTIPALATLNLFLYDFTDDAQMSEHTVKALPDGTGGVANNIYIDRTGKQGHTFGVMFQGELGAGTVTSASLMFYGHDTGNKGLTFDP